MNEQNMKTQVEAALEAALPDIVEGLKRELQQTISWEVKNQVTNQVVAIVTAWTKDNLVDEIHKLLIEEKDGLIALAPSLTQVIMKQLTETLSSNLQKKLESSWERNKLLEALFK